MPHLLTTIAPELTAERVADALLLIQRGVDTHHTSPAPDLALTTQAHKEPDMVQEVEVGTVARNELPDPARFIFENPDGSRRDITGATVEAYLRKPEGTVSSWRTVAITDAANGEAEYTWQDGDTDTPSIGDVGLKLVAVVTVNGMRHFSDVMVVQVADTYASGESFADL